MPTTAAWTTEQPEAAWMAMQPLADGSAVNEHSTWATQWQLIIGSTSPRTGVIKIASGGIESILVARVRH